MIPKAAEVRLAPEDRSVLEMRVRAPTSQQREVFRAPNGRALTGQSHDYKRHGTTTLFAAFDVTTAR